MRFRVLGPLRIWDGTSWLAIGADAQRAVLALLLVEAGRQVRTDRLVDELWGASPPRTARNTAQAYIARLRRALRGGFEPSPLVTRTSGYELTVSESDLDAQVFDQLVDAANRSRTDGDPETALARLHEALALWQGPAFADVPRTPTVAAEAVRLDQARLSALEAKASVQIELGRHADVVDELAGLVGEHPLRERLRALHMLALYRCGRRADALEAYRSGRQLLVDELGIEPGPELRDLEQAILRDDAGLRGPTPAPAMPGTAPCTEPPYPAPAQLPADATAFTGRTAQVRALDAMLHGDGPARSVTVAVLVGAASAGKTALAVHWAHRVCDRFPDGQLYVDLRGYATEPALRPIDALARLLPALGVPARRIPAEVDEAAGLYRSLLSGKRVLVVLDNARHTDHVRALLPGSPGCRVLVTSRDRPAGLVARDGATVVSVGVLTAAEARRLLSGLLGIHGIPAEPHDIGELAELCGRLPLALRIAAAHLITHPGRRVGELAAQLRLGDRLDALTVEGDSQATLRAAFDLSYASLPSQERRLFRLLGLSPGYDIGVPAAAALGYLPTVETARLLDRLSGAHLIEERTAGRYGLHDLVGLYAIERAEAEDDKAVRAAALERLFDHYLRTAHAAAATLYTNKARLPLPSRIAHRPTGSNVENHTKALEWLDAERQNLAAVVRHASTYGSYESAWLISDVLRGYFSARQDTVDWPIVAQAALHAAEACGDPRGQASAHLSFGNLHWVQGDYAQALRHNDTAVALARRAGWPVGESTALANLGSTHLVLGELSQAADCLTQALHIDRTIGREEGQALKLGNLGVLHLLLGKLDQAADLIQQGIASQHGETDRAGKAVNLALLAAIYHAQGDIDLARATLDQVYVLSQEIGSRESRFRPISCWHVSTETPGISTRPPDSPTRHCVAHATPLPPCTRPKA